MTWNFDYTIPSIIVLSFFVIYYFLKPNYLLKSNKYFLSLLIIEVLGLISDISSSYAVSKSSDFCRLPIIILNASYFFLFVLRHYIISLYFASLLNVKTKKDIPTIITSCLVILFFICIIINVFYPQIYSISADGQYIRGKYFLITYYICLITLILDLYYILKLRKKLNVQEMVASLFSILALLAGSLMKIFFLKYLLIDMFFLFVIISLFLAFENPEFYIEKKTGLYNQQSFKKVIEEYFFRKAKFSMLTFFIKNYQEKREIYGNKQMDFALHEIGKYFKYNLPNKKIFYLRNGKISIIENNPHNFEYIKSKIYNRFNLAWEVCNANIHLNISTIEMDSDIKFKTVDDIYACFRIAMNQFKNTSSKNITISKAFFNEITYNRKVSIALNKAIINDDLLLYLQPIIDSKTNKIIAAEALVRLYDEELGLVPPGHFITMAEKNGSIEQLGDQVLNKVCKFLKETKIVENGIQWINVNLSPIQCQNTQLQQIIDSTVDKYDIKHKLIHLEITEDSMIDSEILKRQMNILITDYYDFSLDDFGTGFSNVSRLKSFPFSNIKIDMSVVKEHFNSPDNILPSFIQAFKSRGLTVTAEGVETEEMAESLKTMGCEYLQGYYFSKPIPTYDFEQLVLKNNKKG